MVVIRILVLGCCCGLVTVWVCVYFGLDFWLVLRFGWIGLLVVGCVYDIRLRCVGNA